MAISSSEIIGSQTIFPSQCTFKGEEWNTVRLCGGGTFSKCFHIRNKNGRNLAVKVYKPGKKYEFAFQNEVQMYLSLLRMHSKPSQRSYIVNYIDNYTASGINYIFMEFLGCDLKELLIKHDMKGFSMYLVKKILHDLMCAVMYLEEAGIVHGDIKPSNVLWNRNLGCFQLIDFSISFKAGMPNNGQPLQSLGYQAPEVLQWNSKIKGDSVVDEGDYSLWLDTSIDIWTIGCVLVYVTTGQQLYSTEHAQQLPLICTDCESNCVPCIHSFQATNLITSTRNELPVGDIIYLTYIVSGLLQCHPGNRFRPSDVLNHQFLTESPTPEASITELLFLPTTVLRLLDMFHENDSNTEDVLLDIQEECEKYGEVVSMRTHKKKSESLNVYVEYKFPEDCCKAQATLTGRYFDNRFVVATFFPCQLYQENNLY